MNKNNKTIDLPNHINQNQRWVFSEEEKTATFFSNKQFDTCKIGSKKHIKIKTNGALR